MKHLTTILDKVASELESRGLVKLAAELDVVSNTLEKDSESLLKSAAFSKKTLREILKGGGPGGKELPVPPEAEPHLDTVLWLHEYNRNWSSVLGEKPHVMFDNNNSSYPELMIDRVHLSWHGGKWLPLHRSRNLQNAEKDGYGHDELRERAKKLEKEGWVSASSGASAALQKALLKFPDGIYEQMEIPNYDGMGPIIYKAIANLGWEAATGGKLDNWAGSRVEGITSALKKAEAKLGGKALKGLPPKLLDFYNKALEREHKDVVPVEQFQWS